MENWVTDVVAEQPEPRIPAGRIRLVRVDGLVLPIPERMIAGWGLTFYRNGRALDLDEITVGFLP